MSKRQYVIMWIVIYALISCTMFTGWSIAAAQDTPTPEGTAIVELPPVATVAPIETATPPDNPRGGIQWDDIAPYLFLIIGVLVLAFFTLGTTALVLVYRSMPPAGQAALVGVVSALLGEYRKEAAVSPDALDDMVSKALDAKWDDLIAKFNAATFSVSANHASLVG